MGLTLALVEGGALFRLFITLELQTAQRLQYCMSIVFLTPDPAGHTISAQLVKRIAKGVAGHLRASDIIATLRRSMIGIVLIDASGASSSGDTFSPSFPPARTTRRRPTRTVGACAGVDAAGSSSARSGGSATSAD